MVDNVRKFLSILAALSFFTSSYAAPQIYGPLETQNNFSEITSNGTQATAEVNLFGYTITLGGNFATSGANPVTLTTTGTTNVTLPTSGTLLTTAGAASIYAPLNSPAFTGIPTAPTASVLIGNTQIATTGYSTSLSNYRKATIPINLGSTAGGTLSFATNGIGLTQNFTASGGVITSLGTIFNGGSGYAVGDVVTFPNNNSNVGNNDDYIEVTSVSGTAVTGDMILYGGSGYVSGTNETVMPPNGFPTVFVNTGTLTSNLTIILPNGTGIMNSDQVGIYNNTTGSFSMTFCLSNGSDACNGGHTVVIPQGTSNSAPMFLENDATTGIYPLVGGNATFVNLGATGTVTGIGLIGVQFFGSSSATYTPDPGTQAVIVIAMGGGGGGGGSATTSAGQSAVAGGGSGGSWGEAYFTSGFSGVTVTAGGGVAGGAAGMAGGTGPTASFGSLISCPGGVGGTAGTATSSPETIASSSVPSASCTASGGTQLYTTKGSASKIGLVITAGTVSASGQGADCPWGQGGRAITTESAGQTAAGHCSGGGGALSLASSGSGETGGTGGGALVIVYEFN